MLFIFKDTEYEIKFIQNIVRHIGKKKEECGPVGKSLGCASESFEYESELWISEAVRSWTDTLTLPGTSCPQGEGQYVGRI